MNKIIIPMSKINILSFILFVIVVMVSVIFQYLNLNFITIQSSIIHIFMPIILCIIHEALHYIGFLLIAKVKVKQLKLTPINLNMLPYITTDMAMKPHLYAYVLIFPTLLSGIIFFSILLTPNIVNCLLFGIAIGIAGGDILLAIELFKLDKSSKVVPIGEEWGVFVLKQQQEESSIDG